MDRRSWPWKKKSSDKLVAASDSVGASLASKRSLGDLENYQKNNYVQISMDTYTHLIGLEDEVKDLNEKLSAAHSEMTTRDTLVKQHAKVAEEAVSGWEEAGAEALALKHQLESVTLLKLTAEDQASQLDVALKECTRQISVKEENEKKLQEVVLTKTKQWNERKLELEAKIVDLDQRLLRSAAENAALSRSLQDQSNMLMNIIEEKSQAESEVVLLKENMQSKEKEISSLNYELQIASKELDIRNEEKNMSMKSAEVANKQHLESVKKIAKLEAECQRLRSLVRKKLPGPAALAQMKLEVENLDRDSSEPQLRRDSFKNPDSHLSPLPDFSIEKFQQYHKERELLATHLLAMEEETKMVKEALAMRSSELQASRNMSAKMVGKLKSLETQVQALNQQRSSPKSKFEILTEGSLSQNASNPPRLVSMSEDGFDDEVVSSKSWSMTPISNLSHSKSDKSTEKFKKPASTNHLELMDDFLEMERLAFLSNDSNGDISITSSLNDTRNEIADHNASVDAAMGWDLQSKKLPDLNPAANQVSSNVEILVKELEPDSNQLPLLKLQSRISMILESQTKDPDIRKVLEDIKGTMQDIQDSLPHQSASCFSVKTRPYNASGNQRGFPNYTGEAIENGISLSQGREPGTDKEEHNIQQNLVVAISQIHQFVLALGGEAMQFQDTSTMRHTLAIDFEHFSASVNKFLSNKISLIDFVLELSQILAKVSDLNFSVTGFKGHEGKITSFDLSRQNFPDGHIVKSTSGPVVFHERNFSPSHPLVELEQLKSENASLEMELARCTQDLEITKLKLQDVEQLQAELKSQLASSKRSNILAETQLKCMAETYKSLETHAQELEAEVKNLHAKAENLDNELREERRNHQDALARCKDLQEQMQRNESYSMSSLSSAADFGIKIRQERERAAAAEKLAECQDTIHLLGKQLKALHPQTEIIGSQNSKRRLQIGKSLIEDKQSHNPQNPHSIHRSHKFDRPELDSVASTDAQGAGEESSLLHNFNSPLSPSDIEATPSFRSLNNSNFQNHRPTNTTSSSSSSSAPAPEKQPHSGFNRRFFSSKDKNTH